MLTTSFSTLNAKLRHQSSRLDHKKLPETSIVRQEYGQTHKQTLYLIQIQLIRIFINIPILTFTSANFNLIEFWLILKA